MSKLMFIRILAVAIVLGVIGIGTAAFVGSRGSDAAPSTSTPTYQPRLPVDRYGDAQPDF